MPAPSSSGTGRRNVEPAARDDVVPMTTALFAMGTKHNSNTVQQQERLLRDQLVLIRHGERQDHVDRAWKGNSLLPVLDPPLSNTGRKQSFETALKYFALQQEKKVEQRIQGTFSAIITSPFHRCLETALILNIVAFQGSLAVFVDPLLSDWQQSKVFRVAPTLAGRFTLQEAPVGKGKNPSKGNAKHNAGATGGETAGALSSSPLSSSSSLVFRPNTEALRTALGPFFQGRVDELDTLAEAFKVSPDAAAAWATNLDAWLQHHEALPVWTSEETESSLRAHIATAAESQASAAGSAVGSGHEPSARGKGRRSGAASPGKASPTPADGGDTVAGPSYAQCGVPHPEGKADLQRRCQQVERTHFLASDPAQRQVPLLIRAAVAKEQKERLPKYFQTFDMRPEASRVKAGAPALLPPMHFMCVTHADVVAGMVDVCCPRHLGDASGKSVPYCSVTVLHRHNNYYRIPPLEERATGLPGGASGPGGGAGKGKQRGYAGRGSGGPRTNAMRGRTAGSALAANASGAEEPSADWEVGVVGSTDLLLTTRVLLQFS